MITHKEDWLEAILWVSIMLLGIVMLTQLVCSRSERIEQNTIEARQDSIIEFMSLMRVRQDSLDNRLRLVTGTPFEEWINR